MQLTELPIAWENQDDKSLEIVCLSPNSKEFRDNKNFFTDTVGGGCSHIVKVRTLIKVCLMNVMSFFNSLTVLIYHKIIGIREYLRSQAGYQHQVDNDYTCSYGLRPTSFNVNLMLILKSHF